MRFASIPAQNCEIAVWTPSNSPESPFPPRPEEVLRRATIVCFLFGGSCTKSSVFLGFLFGLKHPYPLDLRDELEPLEHFAHVLHFSHFVHTSKIWFENGSCSTLNFEKLECHRNVSNVHESFKEGCDNCSDPGNLEKETNSFKPDNGSVYI